MTNPICHCLSFLERMEESSMSEETEVTRFSCVLCTQEYFPSVLSRSSLSCSHSMCERCLSSVWEKNEDNLFECPRCGVSTAKPLIEVPIVNDNLGARSLQKVLTGEESMDERQTTKIPVIEESSRVETHVVTVNCEDCGTEDESDRVRMCLTRECDQYLQPLCLLCCVEKHHSHQKSTYVPPKEKIRVNRGVYKTFDISDFPDKRIIEVRGREIAVSASYLSSYSSFLRDLFYGSVEARSKDRLSLDCDADLLEDVLDMLYPSKKNPVCCDRCVSTLPGRLTLSLHLNLPILIEPLLEEFQKFYSISELHDILSESDEIFERFVMSTLKSYDEILEGFGETTIEKMEEGGDKLNYDHVRERFTHKSLKRKEVARSFVNFHFPDARILRIDNTSMVVSASFLSLHSHFFRHLFYSSHSSEREVKCSLFDAPSFFLINRIFMHCLPEFVDDRLFDLLDRIKCKGFVEECRERLMKAWRETSEIECSDTRNTLSERTLALLKYCEKEEVTKKELCSLIRWMNRTEVTNMVNKIDKGAVNRVERERKNLYGGRKRKRAQMYEEEDSNDGSTNCEEKKKYDLVNKKGLTHRILMEWLDKRGGNICKKIMVSVKSKDSITSVILPSSAIVEDVKRKLESNFKVPYKAIDLIKGGKVMKNGRFLAEYAIAEGEEIEMKHNEITCT